MESKTLTIIFGIFGIIGVLFGIYAHFSNKKSAKLFIDLKEISEFKLPIEFYKNIPSLPLSIIVKNLGNKIAENIILNIDLNSEILNFRVECNEKFSFEKLNSKLKLKVSSLNPNEYINIFINCEKGINPTMSIVREINLTLSEGKVIVSEQSLYQEVLVDALINALPFGLGRLIKNDFTK